MLKGHLFFTYSDSIESELCFVLAIASHKLVIRGVKLVLQMQPAVVLSRNRIATFQTTATPMSYQKRNTVGSCGPANGRRTQLANW